MHNGYSGRHTRPQNILPSSFFPQLLILSMVPYGIGHPFGQLGPAVLTVSPSNSSCPSSPSLAGLYEKQRSPWLSASNTLQQLKHQFVFSTIFITNPKYSTIWTTMKKIQSIPTPKQMPSVLHFLQVGAFYLQCLLPVGLFALLSNSFTFPDGSAVKWREKPNTSSWY